MCIQFSCAFDIGSRLENYTSNNTTQHEYNTTQQEATRVQHETTRVQNDTSRVQHSINFILIYLHHRCILGTWYIKAKALLMF